MISKRVEPNKELLEYLASPPDEELLLASCTSLGGLSANQK
jgi:hypothetical protein